MSRNRGATVAAVPGVQRPWDMMLAGVAAFMLIGMARVHSFIPGAAALRPGILIAAVCIALYFATNVRERRFHHLGHPLAFAALGFFCWAALGAPFGLFPGQSVRFIAGEFFRLLIFFILVAAVVRNMHDVRRLLMTLAIGGMVFSFFAAMPAGFRGVRGGGYDPNDSAMFIASTIPIGVYFAMRERRLLFKLLFALGLLLSTVAIVRTGSRGGFLAFAAVVAYVLIFFKGIRPFHRIVVVGGIVGIMSIAASTQYWDTIRSINDPDDYNQTSQTGRKAIWARARGYMVQNPLFGVGINNFSVAEGRHPMVVARIASGRGFKYSVAHSMWYQVGAETGFPGLALFGGMFIGSIVLLRRVIRRARDDPDSAELADAAGYSSALIGSVIALAVAGTFLSNAYWGMVWGVFALVVGMLKVLRFQGVDVANSRRGRSRGSARRVQPANWRVNTPVHHPVRMRGRIG